MRRWNGWGDETVTYPLPAGAADYLSQRLGSGQLRPDAMLDEVVATVPASRLPAHPLIDDDPLARLRHARGQSLPDWVALRSGRIGAFPDGVAWPESDDAVRTLLDYAAEVGAHLIPYGGGTSVVGHINPLPDAAPVLTVDMSRIDQVLRLDPTSYLAEIGAGASGLHLEQQLRTRGFTLGHYPQSFEYATLGGWIATRSSGQQSYYYGRIEDLLAGVHVETPLGPLDLPPLPASAAGPDLRQLVLGSEGRLGLITRAVMRVRPLPQAEEFRAAFFKHWSDGVAAARQMTQAGVAVSMLRLSDAQETETTLVLSGKERLVRWADRGLRLLRYGDGRCLLIYGLTGARQSLGSAGRQVRSFVRSHGGLPVGGMIGSQWQKSRFRSPYLRNTLWEQGYAIDTLETALPWSDIEATAEAIKDALNRALNQEGEEVLAFAHLSHVYRDGASIYVTYLFRRAGDPDQTLLRWQRLKEAASRTIVAAGGTISHQHGVGLDHTPYLAAEKGRIGLAWLRATRQAADPQGLLNPGKLLPEREAGQEDE
ncbi:MAG: FAD-binding oxidoreductase [Candidatus Promineifilaceae bacterium]|nr:FAD-binding oxidoreductase [Candidatus Promineifilaceae bacterium]